MNVPESVDTGPDITGLEEFVQASDRDEPAHFAGREAEIRAMEGLLANVRDKGAGLTRVIAVAPGAGKSALLGRLVSLWKESKAARPVLLAGPDFSDPAKVITAMFNAIDADAARRFGVTETRTKGGHSKASGNLFVAEMEAGGHLSHSTQRTNLPVAFFDAFRELKDTETPVVLLVDEAQLWGTDLGDPNRRYSSLLTEAHLNQQRLPLLVVAAGLGDTKEVLAQRGASKLATNARLVLGPLSNEEMSEVCVKFFERFGVTGSDDRRAEWTEAHHCTGTDGWPRHLDQCVARGGTGADCRAAAICRSRRSMRHARAGWASGGSSTAGSNGKPFQGMPELLAAVFSAMPKETGGTAGKIEDAIDAAYEAHPKLERRMVWSQVFTTLLHQGLIQDFSHNHYDCPIPSMRVYVEEFCAHSGCPIRPAAAPPVRELSGGMEG